MKSYQGLREKNLSALITTCWQLLKLNFSTPKMSDFLILNWGTRLTQTKQWTDCGLRVLTVKTWFAVRKPFCTWLYVVMSTLPLAYFIREHRQKALVTLSGFWPLGGGGVWANPLKKEDLSRKYLFSDIVE